MSVVPLLRYPFQISKSALYSVGSLHTWPGLLAALTWVVELLSYEERAEQLRQDGVLLDEGGQLNVFNEYVGRAYEHFLAGEDESCVLMDQQLEGRFQQQDQDLQLELDRLVQANVALQVSVTIQFVMAAGWHKLRASYVPQVNQCSVAPPSHNIAAMTAHGSIVPSLDKDLFGPSSSHLGNTTEVAEC